MNARVLLTALAASLCAVIAQAAPSPDGTAITAPGSPPALNASFGALADPAGNTWSVQGGVISMNGALQVGTRGVYELLLCGGSVYQFANANKGVWKWSGTGAASSWVPSSDPSSGCPLVKPIMTNYSAVLTWSASGRDVNGNATQLTGFNIYCGSSAATMKKIASVAPTVRTYTVSNLPSGTIFCTETATNAIGESQLLSTTPSVPESVLSQSLVIGVTLP